LRGGAGGEGVADRVCLRTSKRRPQDDLRVRVSKILI
jgi:hypothetical protein